MPRTAPAAESVVVDWYEHHFARLVRLAERMLNSTAGAEDVAQEALFRAWAHHDALDRREAIGPWLTAVARNLCIDQLRRERNTLPLDRIAEPATADDAPADRSEAVLRAMSRINPRHRNALYMHHVGHVGYGDLAERMGIAEPAARMVVVRARRALRTQLRVTLAASA
jgi:RNA polymerase sigma-70 factor (ECF subfamily)